MERGESHTHRKHTNFPTDESHRANMNLNTYISYAPTDTFDRVSRAVARALPPITGMENAHTHTTHEHKSWHIRVHMCLCVCVRMYDQLRDSQRPKARFVFVCIVHTYKKPTKQHDTAASRTHVGFGMSMYVLRVLASSDMICAALLQVSRFSKASRNFRPTTNWQFHYRTANQTRLTFRHLCAWTKQGAR